MTIRIPLHEQKAIAENLAVDLSQVRRPQYGRYLDDFAPGQTFVHPRGFTFDRAEAMAFARTFMQTNPLYLNVQFARAHGFEDLPVSPQFVFNVVLSLGVQNDSEKAMANLGYYQAKFLKPVYPGDTLRAMTHVVSRRERGPDKPGIPHIRTLGVNQRDEVVLQYERKVMVPWRGDNPPASPPPGETPPFPWQDEPMLTLPKPPGRFPAGLTGPRTYFEDFTPGDVIVHANGRTLTDEHVTWTYRVANTHPLHYDRLYSRRQSGPMSGEPIVYGGLVFAWLEGLASRDVSENALWEIGFTEGYHTQPATTRDTVSALSRVLSVEEAPGELNGVAGVVTLQLIGVKNLSAEEALAAYGGKLFALESAKRKRGEEKIPSKIFEIERQLLIKRRP